MFVSVSYDDIYRTAAFSNYHAKREPTFCVTERTTLDVSKQIFSFKLYFYYLYLNLVLVSLSRSSMSTPVVIGGSPLNVTLHVTKP